MPAQVQPAPSVAVPGWYVPGQKLISRGEIENYINQAVVVQDRVYRVYQTKATGTYFVRFDPLMPSDKVFDGFKAVIFPSYAAAWFQQGLNPQMYANQIVRVRGVVQRHPTWGIEILVNSPRVMQIANQATK